MDADNNLFTASLESIETNKRAEKYRRFLDDFQHEAEITLNNAQEWLKAELPIVTEDIDLPALKEEYKSAKASDRRKHLLAALLFEQATRDAIINRNTSTATLMAMHMLNHMWLAKLELYETLPVLEANEAVTTVKEPEPSNEISEKILHTLIQKGEKLQNESRIQENKDQTKISSPKRKVAAKKQPPKENDLWKEEKTKPKSKPKRTVNRKKKSTKKKTKSVFNKMRDKIPLKKKKPSTKTNKNNVKKDITTLSPEEEILFENPNDSAIFVSSGLVEENILDKVEKENEEKIDTYIRAQAELSTKLSNSGVTVRKVLKKREIETHSPGSNTIIMKLASGTTPDKEEKLSLPEQCQQTINDLCNQFPGYDLIAIRNMAAEKVGVSPQYIENLNILPEKAS